MQANATTRETKYSFHLAIEPKDTLVLAHCLELDIMSSGATEEKAIDELIKLIKAHLLYVLGQDLPLYSPAPANSWAKIQNQKGWILDMNVKLTTKKAVRSAKAARSAKPFYKHRDATLCLT